MCKLKLLSIINQNIFYNISKLTLIYHLMKIAVLQFKSDHSNPMSFMCYETLCFM